MVQGSAYVRLTYHDANSAAAIRRDLQEREDLRTSSIIETEVITAVSQKLAAQGLNDLDCILDMLFMNAQPSSGQRVSVKEFEHFLIQELKVPITERALRIFMETNSVLQRGSPNFVEKADLMEVFEDAFRQAKFNEMERSSVLKQDFNRNTMMKNQVHFGGDVTYARYDQSALPPAPSGQPRVINRQGANALGRSYLQETLNDRSLRFDH